jgi:dihydroorotate dehydrogenase electron transfer subunit
MNEKSFTILNNRPIARSVFELTLLGDAGISAPGQFVDIRLPGFFLRRPVSVADWTEEQLVLIYKLVGDGTRALSLMEPGDHLDLLTPLGNGYDLSRMPEDPLLVGGGIGIPPLYGLAKTLLGQGKRPDVLLGFNDPQEYFYIGKFRALGLTVKVKTGGYVTEIMPAGRYVASCGPTAMLRAVRAMAADGQFSLEARMGCGFGACMGCSLETKTGSRRVCKDGPVFESEELLW